MLDDRIYLELNLEKSVSEDANGNYIIRAEASNENLDLQEQIVLQRALLDSKDYFLKNGVISWDHLHKRRDENDNLITDPEYIIGEPLGVEKVGGRVFVKAMLYKGNRIAEDLVDKLRKGATIIKTSVGGMRPKIEKVYDTKLRRPVEKVVSVLWDELACTYKPVNQTLSPVQLVKSLQAGYGTDSATMTGGRALITQDIDGFDDDDEKKRAMKAVIVALATGDCTDIGSARTIIRENGVMDDKIADDILEAIVNGKTKLKGVFSMDDAILKSFDETIESLEKALKPDGEKPPKAQVPTTPEDDALYESEESEEEGGEEDGDSEEGFYGEPEGAEEDGEEGGGDMPMKPTFKKSVDHDDEMDFLDVSADIIVMKKSLDAITKENGELRAMLSGVDVLVKSMAQAQVATANMLKSIASEPTMRKSIISKNPRAFVSGSGDGANDESLGREEILRRTGLAIAQGRMDLRKASIIEDRLNALRPLDQADIVLLKSIQ